MMVPGSTGKLTYWVPEQYPLPFLVWGPLLKTEYQEKGTLIIQGSLMNLAQEVGIQSSAYGARVQPQRLQYPLIKEYTLNHIRDPTMV